MHISSWAAMMRPHGGRQWHCRPSRIINLDCASPPQATRWPDGRSKHIRPWLDCGKSIPRYAFPLSKTCWALIGMPKTSRDSKKDCGEPGCPNDHKQSGSTVCDERDFRCCEGFRMTAHWDDAACTEAVVRKPPVKERAGGWVGGGVRAMGDWWG